MAGSRRIAICRFGVILLKVFWWTVLIGGAAFVVSAFLALPSRWVPWVSALAVFALVESIVFWIGIIAVYLTSVQLGLKIRVIGILCGWIPIVNLVALRLIIRTVEREVRFESEKDAFDRRRAPAGICKTRYPVLLVHGVFFRDTKALNYWGRIPDELERNGARIFYGEHQSASSVADSASELTERIRRIVEQTGCGKVNVIAHSKGGLDMRYAIARCGAGRWVASLTTINTPHRGCGFADYLLSHIPVSAQRKVEVAYNTAAARLGDKAPDFMAAVHDLTQEGCARINGQIGLEPFPGIRCQSVGSRLAHATTGKFPLNFTYPLVKWFDGPNDGLVSKPSFPWGERFIWLEPNGRRGISHADMIDLNRENIEGFDVREFYVGIVAELKKAGL
ncbi:triacylglycerol lipase [Bifidobacterium sp. SMB2]|uniref:Triacylglycerol lipase n=1 Tax=Bifidobacterium saimiriisciurei TaxID=2661627 RepID=A0ABX0CGJ1_9BIFI|nr:MULTISPECIES: triacylglycerol lipase [Bifidobacterium]NEG96930.1 triacylglycerol lipase [Bifidobacterium sp. SMB2]NEH11540.1 triacylglycerol lipase [Bifidobacterium saimiriisciurei]